jgi:hypothetical protein
MEVVEGATNTSPLPAARRIRSAHDALAFATSVGFTDQEVIVQRIARSRTTTYKTLTQFDDFEMTVEALLQADSSVMILADHRAHKAPSRAEIIRMLSERMAL